MTKLLAGREGSLASAAWPDWPLVIVEVPRRSSQAFAKKVTS